MTNSQMSLFPEKRFFTFGSPIHANLYTQKCIICDNDATSWSGHVHLGTEMYIFAGVCNFHRDKISPDKTYVDPTLTCRAKNGCYGFWQDVFGLSLHILLNGSIVKEISWVPTQEELRQIYRRP